jgi:hypothetical protein
MPSCIGESGYASCAFGAVVIAVARYASSNSTWARASSR